MKKRDEGIEKLKENEGEQLVLGRSEIFLGSGLASAVQTRQGGGIYLPIYDNILDIEILVFFVIYYSRPGYTYSKPT